MIGLYVKELIGFHIGEQQRMYYTQENICPGSNSLVKSLTNVISVAKYLVLPKVHTVRILIL